MNFFCPFQPEREFKVYKSCKCSQIICSRVHYYSMFPRLFISVSNFLKLLNKVYNELGEFIKANGLKSAKMSLRKEKAFLIILNQMR